MKRFLFAAATAAALVSAPVLAQSGHPHVGHGAMEMDDAPEQAPAGTMSEGAVKKVDRAAGKLTIAHGPLKNLGMPGMTMAFRVKDPAMLEAVKEGDRIRFVADRVDGTFTVVALEPAN